MGDWSCFLKYPICLETQSKTDGTQELCRQLTNACLPEVCQCCCSMPPGSGSSPLLFCHSCQGQREWAWLWGGSHSSPVGCHTTQKGARSLLSIGRLIRCLQSVFDSKMLWKERHSAPPAIREAGNPSGVEPPTRSSSELKEMSEGPKQTARSLLQAAVEGRVGRRGTQEKELVTSQVQSQGASLGLLSRATTYL